MTRRRDSGRHALGSWVFRLERAADRRLTGFLRPRPGWDPVVVPYISYGTTQRVHVRGRVLLRRHVRENRRRGSTVRTALAHFFSVELAHEPVTVEIAGQVHRATAGPEGYLEATFDLAELAAGWHPVTYRVVSRPGYTVVGRLVVVDPDARLGIVSDIDDTVIHTGLTRVFEAIRSTLFVAEQDRVEIAGASELYQSLVDGADGRAQVFYVSTGAWNLHAVLERFLARHGFPEGPLQLTDWGPSKAWLFREASVAVKTRVINQHFAEHPHLSWILIGDSGQDDPEAYAAVARAQPERVRVVYIRDVPPKSPLRTGKVERFAAELSALGVDLLLVPDSTAAADDAYARGLIDESSRDKVRQAVETERASHSRLTRR